MPIVDTYNYAEDESVDEDSHMYPNVQVYMHVLVLICSGVSQLDLHYYKLSLHTCITN